MVAETHSHSDDVTLDDVVRFIAVDLGGLEGQQFSATTLRECGFEMTLDFVELSQLLGEEFGERTLSGDDLDDVEADTVLQDFALRLYPFLSPPEG